MQELEESQSTIEELKSKMNVDNELVTMLMQEKKELQDGQLDLEQLLEKLEIENNLTID